MPTIDIEGSHSMARLLTEREETLSRPPTNFGEGIGPIPGFPSFVPGPRAMVLLTTGS